MDKTKRYNSSYLENMSIWELSIPKHISLMPKLEKMGGAWRFDGAGNYSTYPSDREYTAEPLVKLHFTRIADNWQNDNGLSLYAKNSNFIGEYKEKKFHNENVGVGCMQFLPPGCVIQSGRIYECLPNRNVLIFSNLYISPAKCKHAYGNKILPPAKRTTNYMLVETNHGRYSGIIIPYAELIRFYHSSSCQLISSLFNGDVLDLNNIVNKEKSFYTDKKEKNYRIHFRRVIPNQDGAIVSRMITCQYAHKAACEVYKSFMLYREKNGNEDIKIRTSFPFTGLTTIKALGINYDNGSCKYFRIIRLLKCHHPFPWDILKISRDNPGDQHGIKIEQTKPMNYGSNPPGTHSGSKNRKLTFAEWSQDPSLLRKMNEILLQEERFADLEKKKIIPSTERIINYHNDEEVKKTTDTNSSQSMATGPGTKQDTGVERINAKNHPNYNSRNPRLRINPDNLYGALDTFATRAGNTLNKELRYVYQSLVFSRQNYEEMLAFPTHRRSGKEISWAFYSHDKEKKRPRVSLLIELVEITNASYFYILETERRVNSREAYSLLIYYNQNLQQLGELTHEDFMIELATKRFSKYREIAAMFDLSVQSLKHSSSTVEQFGKRIKNCINNLTLPQ